MRISIIGCGHVGLVTGACLAALGHEIVCADKDELLIRRLNAGQLPVYETHLDALISAYRRSRKLAFTADNAEAVRRADAIFICVGVKQLENGEADFGAIDNAVRLIAKHSTAAELIVVRSTVPVQTSDKVRHLLNVYGRSSKIHFRVAANPQFLKEGTAVEDFLHPDRILVGVSDAASEQHLKQIYKPILDQTFECPVHTPRCPRSVVPEFVTTGIQSAELIKHVSNAFLATKISYANMVADLCECIGGDVHEVMRAVGLDHRIGQAFLDAGLGFGGTRLRRDTRALCRLAEHLGVDSGMLRQAERVNERRIDLFLEKMRDLLWVINNKSIGMLGLAVKPDTDDTRSSPAVELAHRLTAEGARVRAYDPKAMEGIRNLFPDVSLCESPIEVAENADALIVATGWHAFRNLDWNQIRQIMARPLLFDGRNLLDPTAMKALGFEYHSIGRPDELFTPRVIYA